MPTFVLEDGREYTTEDPGQVNRLRLSTRYTEKGAEKVADPVFHPEQHTVSEVAEYIAANPQDAERVRAEERGGKGRSSLLGE